MALGAFWGGCGADVPTGARVVIEADPEVTTRLTALEVSVLGGPAGGPLVQKRAEILEATSTPPLRWPVRLTLAPEGGDASRIFAVIAVARDASGPFVRARLDGTYSPRETRLYTLRLEGACVGVTCGDEQTCRDGICEDAGPPPPIDGGRPEGGPVDLGHDEAGPPVDLGPSDCDPNEAPNAMLGVFVSARASDDDAMGTPGDPYKTVNAALRALGLRTHVYIEKGVYPEAVELPADLPELTSSGGIVLSGGWRATGADWRRDCERSLDEGTVIDSPMAVALSLRGVTGRVTVERLSLRTKPTGETRAGQSGESLYGVFADTDALALVLRDVRVEAGEAGHGGAAAPATEATPHDPGCRANPCGTGAPGSPGSAGAHGSPGRFTAEGFLPADGEPGTAGTPGAAGTSTEGMCRSDCAMCGAGICDVNSCVTGRHSVCGQPGRCGCGGGPGGGGGGGRGGGASVGILIRGSASTLMLERTSVVAGDAGDGSPGASGASGASGSPGSAGRTEVCAEYCTRIGPMGACYCGFGGSMVPVPGGLGGEGGRGGDGGNGGDGGGGLSFAVALLDGASLVMGPGSRLMHGRAGRGAGEGPSGLSGEVWPPP
jgi:hypothetical protein